MNNLAPTDAFALYQMLWREFAATPASIYYVPSGPSTGADGDAFFFPPRTAVGRPSITFVRDHYEEPAGQPSARRAPSGAHLPPIDVTEELCKLAHEYGHFVSWKGGNQSADYIAARDALKAWREKRSGTLTAEHCALVRAEEARAWAFGRVTLQRLGLTNMDAMSAREAKSTSIYEEIFGTRG